MRISIKTMMMALVVTASTAYAQNYKVGNPNDPTNYGYLKDYAPLKDYIDYERYPNFKLGIGTTVDNYLSGSTLKGVVNDNFTETVAGNAMKMSSCVSNSGTMDFQRVKNYVNTATAAGVNVYGHTLAWHAQQPTGWLNSLIKDKAATPFANPDTTVNVVFATKDFRTNKSVGWTADKTQYAFSIDFSSTDGLHVKTTKKQAFYEVQFQAMTGIPLEKGKNYIATFTIKGSASGTLHTKLGDWSAGVNVNVPFTSAWKDVTVTYKNSTGGDFLLLQCGDFVGDIYIRSIKLAEPVGGIKNGDGTVQLPQSIPLTAQEKRDTLIWAMDKWIKGMMEACGGKVKGWDVVNEAISGGGNDGSGNYTLQHGNGSGDFFWQDHMGDLAYVRSAVRLARKYGPEDIKLFINDYNLESDWDNNKKLKSLINWIKKWEADGETYIDGIGTQMHISYYMNANTQNSKQKGVENMLKLMAQTGKLVRISELDMGVVDANGKDVPTNKVTEDMHHRMADYYEWIIKKYLEIVPPAQQWGICCWCPTDSPAGSGWRADTPVGIWTLDFYRKHVYAGIAEGLGGIASTDIDNPIVDFHSTSSDRQGIYTLSGQRIEESQMKPGIYIVNGQKVIRKF